MASSSNQAQNFDYTVDIESSSGNILTNQNNVFIKGVCDSTVTSVIEEFVDVFDDSFSRTTNLWKPKVSDPKLKPYSGQWFKDIESCFQFYTQYGLQGGFNVRKSTQKVKNKKIVTKYIICLHGGHHETSISKLSKHSDDAMSESSHTSSVVGDQVRRRNTITKKCECSAKVILKSLGPLDSDPYVVSCFIEVHNHPLASESGKKFLRANRFMTTLQQHFLLDASKSNLGAYRAHDIYKSCFGFYSDTDSDGHLTRLFWADVRGRKNYDVFGDVVSFDATYRTNKYGMVFVPFIGVDNHWKSVTFSSALFDHENETNFTWACEMFLKVFCRPPKCIITYQCLAMKVASQKTFPDSIHRYCMWHIMQKFPAKIGPVFCAESGFMEKLNKFVWSSHLTLAEFEEGWNAMLNEFGLSNHVWLNEIYAMRKSWIPTFFRDKPMGALLRTTSGSERLWGVERIPNQFLSRCWLRNAEEILCTLKFPNDLQSSNGHIVKDTSKKILSDFQNSYDKVSNHIEGLNFMLEEMKCLNIRIEEKFHKSIVTKDDMLEEHFGVRPSSASSVLPNLESNNKGSRKRILGPAEISYDGKKRKMKNCRNCKALAFHDSRNCPQKGKQKGKQLQQISLVENAHNTLNQEMESQTVDGQNVHATGTLNSNIEIQTGLNATLVEEIVANH
ncbi:hypothetical protein POM88_048226 [Heracleum sosnowskyi]|uniref:Protein FAR1-RELATED SEQUENCE n=1 Tax=Heracleum sosnowskyi TaxID=360622 RepID=A0AAD8GVY5_9APIA|nr:hypothetical protein POM88_048226 [Heracleum sosnowskyi]